jgi:hypothetical protein
MIRPFFDHAHQHGPCCCPSDLDRTRMMFGASDDGPLGTLHTRRSASAVCAASMSVFDFEEEPCQAKSVICAGARVVLRVWRMAKEGWRVAIRRDPFMYPMAKVEQSGAGASAVIGSKMVRTETCSEVEGSKMTTLPCSLPVPLTFSQRRVYLASSRGTEYPTKSYVSIPHETRRSHIRVR